MKKYTIHEIETYLIDCKGFSQEDMDDDKANGENPEYHLSEIDKLEIERFYN